MKKGLPILFSILVLFVSGCVSVQPPIAYTKQNLNQEASVIGVAVTDIPKADTLEMGNIGLLDMAIIAAASSELTEHLNSLDLSEFADIKTNLKKILSEQGYQVILIEDAVSMKDRKKVSKQENFSKYDFSDLKQQHAISHLLLIEPYLAGTIRSYYGFAPTSDPQAKFSARGSLINLSDNSLAWYHDEDQVLPITGEWDEGDIQFPNVTNAVYKALNLAKDNLEQPLR